jgi:hypothetical protein
MSRSRVGVVEADSERISESAKDWVGIARRDDVRADIAKRIKRACADLPAGEFGELVDEMTDRQLRGERRFNWDFLQE